MHNHMPWDASIRDDKPDTAIILCAYREEFELAHSLETYSLLTDDDQDLKNNIGASCKTIILIWGVEFLKTSITPFFASKIKTSCFLPCF